MHDPGIVRFVLHSLLMLSITSALMFAFSLRRVRVLVLLGCLVTAVVIGVLAYDWTAQGEPQIWTGWLLAMVLAGSRARSVLARSPRVAHFFVPDVPESR